MLCLPWASMQKTRCYDYVDVNNNIIVVNNSVSDSPGSVAQILALPLEKVLPYIINEDQTGFVKGLHC